jgi:distribution and morphology protein 10
LGNFEDFVRLRFIYLSRPPPPIDLDQPIAPATMIDFVDHIERSYYTASKWNIDNSYAALNATAEALLDFPTPRGLRFNISSLATPHFASSYALSLAGPVTGTLSYLFSSRPLPAPPSRPARVPLSALVRGFRPTLPAADPRAAAPYDEVWRGGRRVDDAHPTLLLGRAYLPAGRLDALLARRLSATRLLTLRAVSDPALPGGGSVLAGLHADTGRAAGDVQFSSDSALLGVRGLWNLGDGGGAGGTEAGAADDSPRPGKGGRRSGAFAAGFEVYYGLLNGSAGASTGVRFATLPEHASSFPYAMTLTLNPLVGNLSGAYAVRAGRHASLCARFDFNFYSYESGVVLGCELWRMGGGGGGRRRLGALLEKIDVPPSGSSPDDGINPGIERTSIELAEKLEPVRTGVADDGPADEDVAGVLKARVDQDWKIGLIWEGKFKELLYTVGASVDMKNRERIFTGLGIELRYTS